jgi:hypothetical protein
VGYGNNAMPLKSGQCCDNCNDKYVITARLSEQPLELIYYIPTIFHRPKPLLRFAPRRSQRIRKPSLKAREVNNDAIMALEKGDKNSDYAFSVAMYLTNNYKF